MAYSQRYTIPALEQPFGCGTCVLSGRSTGFARPTGTGANGVLAISERLTDHDVEHGIPLHPAGAAGSIFERLLKQLGLTRSEFKLISLINCKIPDMKLKYQPYEYAAIDACRQHRDPLILNFPETSVTYKKKVILAMGDVVTRTLTGLSGRDFTIEKLRGYPVETSYGLVLPTYDPAELYRQSKLMGVLKYDIQYAVNIAKQGWNPPQQHYQENPTVEEAWAFYNLAKRACDGMLYAEGYGAAGADLPIIAADIENDYGLGADGKGVRVTSVQFSLAKNTGIFLDATEEFLPVIKAIFALRAQFWFHNGWRHDSPILKQIGITFGGPVHDSLWCFHHLQPDLTTQDSKDDNGIGISSKMGLQYVASLYGFPRRWKHLNKMNIRYYGICDVDALQYIVPTLIAQLKAKGMWESYLTHVHRYDPILIRVQERGIPVREETRVAVKKELTLALVKVADEIQDAYPHQLKKLDPVKGYKTVPKVKEGAIRWTQCEPLTGFNPASIDPVDYQEVLEWYDKDDEVWRKMDYRLFTGLNLAKKADCQCFSLQTHNDKGKPFKKAKKVYAQDCPLCAGKKVYAQTVTEQERWAKVLPFKPSPDQLKKYMKFRDHKLPSKKKSDGSRGFTSDFKELQKLAVKYKDPLYTKVVEYRKLEKMIATYIDGWKPGEDGRVHPEYLMSTATGQLASQNPNGLNPPKHNAVLADKFRSMIEAPAGYTFIEMDYKSYHGATLAAESGDEVYYKIAVQAGDAHSFLASYMVKEPIDPTLPLGELIEHLEYIKKKYKQVRNTKAKPANLGYGFGMQGPGLYERNQESFDNQQEACELISMLDSLYSGNKAWRDAQVLEAYRNGGYTGSGFLMSKFNHIRWFNAVYQYTKQSCVHCQGQEGYNYQCWVCKGKGSVWNKRNGGDVEDIYAFKPANNAHCNFREVQVRLDDKGLLEKYNLVLPYHDALYMLCPDVLLDEAIQNVYTEMVQPIIKLANPKLCPAGLVVDVDVNVGKSWDKMSSVKMTL